MSPWELKGPSHDEPNALLHDAIFPATCNSTDDRMARQDAEYVLHAATYLATLRTVES